MKNGNEKNTYHNHCQRLAKIILYKPHSICVCLARCRQEGDGTGLCAHDAQQYKSPWDAAVGKKIAIQVMGSTAPE